MTNLKKKKKKKKKKNKKKKKKKKKNTQQKYISLASVKPTYNPYHKSWINGVDFRIRYGRYVTGVVVYLPDSLGSVMNSIPKGFFFFTEYAAVNYCEGSRVLCNVLISTQLQKKKNQMPITNSKGEVSNTHYRSSWK